MIEVVVESSAFDGEVITLCNERYVGFETSQSLGKGMAGALLELVVFIQDARVGWRGGAGFGEGLERVNGIVEHIEVPDAEIAPGCSERGVKRNGALPHLDGFAVAAAVI